MVAPLLPPLPPEHRDDFKSQETYEDESVDGSAVEDGERLLEEAFAYDELGQVDSDSYTGTPSKDYVIRERLTPQSRFEDSRRQIWRKPLPVDSQIAPLPQSSAASSDANYTSNSDFSSKSHSPSIPTPTLDRPHSWFDEAPSQSPARHVRFASPLPHRPLPLPPPALSRVPPHRSQRVPLDHLAPAHAPICGPRPPPWGSSEDLAMDRRYRSDMRAYDHDLDDRFAFERWRLVQKRKVAEEKVRTGERWTGGDEVQELIRRIYPEFDDTGRGRVCCVIM